MMIELDPTTVKVRDGLTRYRKEMGKVESLANSIIQYGQLQPIVITEDRELIAGGRRLAACIFANVKVKAIYRKDIKEDDQIRAAEIIENIDRKAFTPAEEQLAIAELHRIKMGEAGEDVASRKQNKEWNMEKTAQLLNLSKAAISAAVNDAAAIKANPELKEAKTKGEIRNKAAKIERFKKAFQAVEQAKKAKVSKGVKEKKYSIEVKEAQLFMSEQPDSSADIIITDPPYMIDIHKNRQLKVDVDYYEDSKELSEYMLSEFPSQCFRVLKPTGSIYMFIGSEWFFPFTEAFTKAGFKVYWKEIIWVKNSTGQTNNPDMWPGDCYEKIFFARKPENRLVKEGMPNWVHCSPVAKSPHQAEKPLYLIENLITRSCYPKETLLDPFCGSGAILEAGLKKDLYVKGCDIESKFVALAEERMLKYA